MVWFLKCESRNARRAKSVGQLDLGYAVRSRALPWAGSCLACFGRLYNNVGFKTRRVARLLPGPPAGRGSRGSAPCAPIISIQPPYFLAARVIRALTGPGYLWLRAASDMLARCGACSAQALWPFESFAAAVVGLMLGWFLKCESRNARRAKYVCLAWAWVLWILVSGLCPTPPPAPRLPPRSSHPPKKTHAPVALPAAPRPPGRPRPHYYS